MMIARLAKTTRAKNLSRSTGQKLPTPAFQASRRPNGRSASCSALPLTSAPFATAESRNRAMDRRAIVMPIVQSSALWALTQLENWFQATWPDSLL